MAGRRREARFLPSSPWNAALHTVEDVVLDRSDRGEIWVLAETPGRPGDLTLEIATGGLRLDVRVVQSEPALVDGMVRHRLRLRVTEPAEYETPASPDRSLVDAPGNGGPRHAGKNHT